MEKSDFGESVVLIKSLSIPELSLRDVSLLLYPVIKRGTLNFRECLAFLAEQEGVILDMRDNQEGVLSDTIKKVFLKTFKSQKEREKSYLFWFPPIIDEDLLGYLFGDNNSGINLGCYYNHDKRFAVTKIMAREILLALGDSDYLLAFIKN